MSGPEDVLGRDVAVGVQWDDTSMSLKAKSRAVAGFDRLLGSLMDLPAAYLEGPAAKKRQRDEIDRRLMLVQAEIAEKTLRGAATAGDAILLDMMKREARHRANAGAVAIEALEELKALPPPEGAAAPQQPEEAQDLDEDWLNQFSRYAEDASSERLQQLWGRVLAGEVRRPGSFSRHTLRFIAELDKETAQLCEFAVERAVGTFIPATGEWESGEGFMIGMELRRHGLMDGIGTVPPRQTLTLQDGHVLIPNREFGALFFGPEGHQLAYDIFPLTRMGIEVFSLLTPKDPIAPLRSLAQKLATPPITAAHLGKIGPLDPMGKRSFAGFEVVWQTQPPS